MQGRGDGACPCLNAMPPKNLRFGGGSGGTILHPLVAMWILIAIVLILALPRKKAIVPFVLAFFSTPMGQLLVLGGVHVTMLQILILTVFGRMAAFKESASEKRFSGGFNSFDKLVVTWTLVGLLAFSLEFMDIQAVIKGLGDLVVSLGGYLAVRFLIPDREAIRRTVKVLAVICVIQGVCMISEQFTHQNLFKPQGRIRPRRGRATFAPREQWALSRRGLGGSFDSSLFLAVGGEKIPDGSVRRNRRGNGDGVRITRQHIMDGLWGKLGGACFLAFTQAHEAGAMGTCCYTGGPTHRVCMDQFGR